MLQGIPAIMTSRQAVRSGFYRSLTLDMPASDLTNFPVLFSGTFTYLKTVANGGKVQNVNGYDIAFYSDSSLTTLLKFERVNWDATTGTCEFWIKIPTLSSASSTVIYLAYGNTTIITDLSDTANVWDTNFKGVFHLKDGTTLSAVDSTSNGNSGTNFSMSPAAGKIDGAASNNTTGGTNRIELGVNNIPDVNGLQTVSMWVKTSQTAATTVPLTISNLSTRGNHHASIIGDGKFQVAKWGGGTTINSNFSVSTGVWYHVVYTWDGTNSVIYVNGTSQNSNTTSPQVGSISSAIISGYDSSSTDGRWNGSIDELRISTIARNADWIAAEYSNQNDPDNFYIIGSET